MPAPFPDQISVAAHCAPPLSTRLAVMKSQQSFFSTSCPPVFYELHQTLPDAGIQAWEATPSFSYIDAGDPDLCS